VAPAMRERRRPNHPVHAAMRSRISDTSVIQTPVSHVLAIPREEGDLDHTWSGNRVHLHVVEARYSITHDNVQGEVD
jgi:hypothetical protein